MRGARGIVSEPGRTWVLGVSQTRCFVCYTMLEILGYPDGDDSQKRRARKPHPYIRDTDGGSVLRLAAWKASVDLSDSGNGDSRGTKRRRPDESDNNPHVSNVKLCTAHYSFFVARGNKRANDDDLCAVHYCCLLRGETVTTTNGHSCGGSDCPCGNADGTCAVVGRTDADSVAKARQQARKWCEYPCPGPAILQGAPPAGVGSSPFASAESDGDANMDDDGSQTTGEVPLASAGAGGAVADEEATAEHANSDARADAGAGSAAGSSTSSDGANGSAAGGKDAHSLGTDGGNGATAGGHELDAAADSGGSGHTDGTGSTKAGEADAGATATALPVGGGAHHTRGAGAGKPSTLRAARTAVTPGLGQSPITPYIPAGPPLRVYASATDDGRALEVDSAYRYVVVASPHPLARAYHAYQRTRTANPASAAAAVRVDVCGLRSDITAVNVDVQGDRGSIAFELPPKLPQFGRTALAEQVLAPHTFHSGGAYAATIQISDGSVVVDSASMAVVVDCSSPGDKVLEELMRGRLPESRRAAVSAASRRRGGVIGLRPAKKPRLAGADTPASVPAVVGGSLPRTRGGSSATSAEACLKVLDALVALQQERDARQAGSGGGSGSGGNGNGSGSGSGSGDSSSPSGSKPSPLSSGKPTAKVWSAARAQRKYTLLHVAARHGHVAVLKRLLELGVDLSDRCDDGTALEVATSFLRSDHPAIGLLQAADRMESGTVDSSDGAAGLALLALTAAGDDGGWVDGSDSLRRASSSGKLAALGRASMHHANMVRSISAPIVLPEPAITARSSGRTSRTPKARGGRSSSKARAGLTAVTTPRASSANASPRPLGRSHSPVHTPSEHSVGGDSMGDSEDGAGPNLDASLAPLVQAAYDPRICCSGGCVRQATRTIPQAYIDVMSPIRPKLKVCSVRVGRRC